MVQFVTYIRVSTRKQQASGLGLEAQQVSIAQYVGNRGEVLGEFVEVESGKHNDRPELLKALKLCRITGATLIVATISRLSRNAAFLMTLRDSNVQFVCCDLPEANTLTVGLMAVIAQHEREQISARTKAALAAAKARGVALGGFREGHAGVAQVASLGTQARQAKALKFAEELRDHLDGMTGLSLQAIADRFNVTNVRTPRGTRGNWTPKTVSRVLDRLTA